MSQCEPDRASNIIYLNYILTPLCITSAISIIPAVYIFIRAYFNGDLKTLKTLYYTGLALFLLCAMFCICGGISFALYCYHRTEWLIFANISVQTYNLQMLLLIAILYYRLMVIFQGTDMALSKCTNVSFWIYFALTSIVGTFTAANWANDYFVKFVGAFQGISGLLAIILIIFLVSLFVVKLHNVHTISAQNGGKIKDTIVRTSILAFISTFCTILHFIFQALAAEKESPHWDFVRNMVALFDVYTNFICTFLSYGYFRPHYLKICKHCNVCCHRLWISRFNEETAKDNVEVGSMSSPSSQSK